MAIREGRWDCPTCGHVGNLGRDQVCPSCGSPRPKGVRFYLPADAPEVTDEAQLAQAKAGADWLCQFCGSSNSNAKGACTQCGAIRGTSPSRESRDYALADVPTTGEQPRPQRKPRPTAAVTAPSWFPRLPTVSPRTWRIAAAVLVGIVALVTFLNWPRYRIITPVAFHWERTIDVEDYRTVEEEDWSIPEGGRQKSQRTEIHHYTQVLDHYETRTRQVSEQVQTGTETYVSGQRDLGNGYFEDIRSTRPVYQTRTRTETYQEPIYRSVPIYATKYRYEIERWLKNRQDKASGDDQRPHWPGTHLGTKEREGPRSARYVVRFEDDRHRPHERVMSEGDFLKFQKGIPYKARFSSFGRLVDVKP